MIRELIPWTQLTRTGIPPLKVARRPLQLGEVSIPVGEAFNPELFPLQIRAERLRQFYEMRRLEPVNPPVDTRQFYREMRAAQHAQSGAAELVAPIVPVASHIVADRDELPADELPTVEVPIAELPEAPDIETPFKKHRWQRGRPRKE